MKNPFKAIWNYLFPEKKKVKVDSKGVIELLKKKEQSKEKWNFNSDDLSKYIVPRTTKNDFRKLALANGYEARYSGKQRFFYLHKIQFN